VIRAATLLLLLVVSGCAPTLETVRAAPLDRDDFFGTLAREQRRHALRLGRDGATLPEAERFARKAAAAIAGEIAPPEPAGSPAMTAARDRLTRLTRPELRDRCPVFAALALARYDAWSERERAWPGGEEAERLRREFEANAAALETGCALAR
jgi:hypothetical protein